MVRINQKKKNKSTEKSANIGELLKELFSDILKPWEIIKQIIEQKIPYKWLRIVIFILCVIVATVWSLKDRIYEQLIKEKPPFVATIRIVDWNGRSNKLIEESSSTINILDKKPQPIINGQVEFNNISAKLENQKVKIYFIPGINYSSLELVKDSIVLKKSPEVSELKIKVKGLDEIHGYTRDSATGQVIIGAKVTIRGIPTLCDISNNDGRYHICIPIEHQELEQTIEATKDSLRGYTIKYLMGNKNDIDIILE